MSTTWPPALDAHQGVAERLAKVVEEMSGGRFRIEVFLVERRQACATLHSVRACLLTAGIATEEQISAFDPAFTFGPVRRRDGWWASGAVCGRRGSQAAGRGRRP